MIFNDQSKFLALILKIVEEKNTGKKYVGKIEFDSQLFGEMSPLPNPDSNLKQKNPRADKARQEKNQTQKPVTSAAEGMERNKREKKPSVKFSDQQESKVEKSRKQTAPVESESEAMVLVIPPLALSNERWVQIMVRYNVIEVMKL